MEYGYFIYFMNIFYLLFKKNGFLVIIKNELKVCGFFLSNHTNVNN